MALPVLSKTWQFNVNNAVALQATAIATNRLGILGMKNALLGFGSNPMTCYYSCNSVTAGTAGDGVDRWASSTDLVWAVGAVAHSWYVLRDSAAGIYILLSGNQAVPSGNQFGVSVSTVGFTGGSTTVDPTATDQATLIGNTVSFLNPSNTAIRYHVLRSTDGQVTRVLMFQNNLCWLFFTIENPANQVSGWTNAIVAQWTVGTTTLNATSALTLSSVSTPLMKLHQNATFYASTLTGEGVSSGLAVRDTTFGNLANEIDGAWSFYPIGICGVITPVRGRVGSLYDIWWGSTSVPTGSSYPSTGTLNQFAQFGDIILPWNLTTPTTA